LQHHGASVSVTWSSLTLTSLPLWAPLPSSLPQISRASHHTHTLSLSPSLSLSKIPKDEPKQPSQVRNDKKK